MPPITSTLTVTTVAATVCCTACATSATLSPDQADQWATSHRLPQLHAITFTIGNSPKLHVYRANGSD